MNPLIGRLNPKERRGSKPRCHLLTHGTSDEVAERLTALVAPFATVSAHDCWMPVGFAQVQEAELNKTPRLLSADVRAKLGAWWLPAERAMAPSVRPLPRLLQVLRWRPARPATFPAIRITKWPIVLPGPGS